jgi:hypothetical protein
MQTCKSNPLCTATTSGALLSTGSVQSYAYSTVQSYAIQCVLTWIVDTAIPTASTGTTVPSISLHSSGVITIAPSVVIVVIITLSATLPVHKSQQQQQQRHDVMVEECMSNKRMYTATCSTHVTSISISAT